MPFSGRENAIDLPDYDGIEAPTTTPISDLDNRYRRKENADETNSVYSCHSNRGAGFGGAHGPPAASRAAKRRGLPESALRIPTAPAPRTSAERKQADRRPLISRFRPPGFTPSHSLVTRCGVWASPTSSIPSSSLRRAVREEARINSPAG